MKMKKHILLAALLLAAFQPLKADEGMWLPALISRRIGDMQAKGFQLSAEDIYSVNQASLKDAVVLFGSGCTGELVSDRDSFSPTTTAATAISRSIPPWSTIT